MRISAFPARRFLFQARFFHSPFVVLNAANNSPTSPSQHPTTSYEKQHEPSPEPHLSSSGTRTYLVSEPDPSNTPYQVPTGAYPASSPYLNFTSSAPIPEAPHNSSQPHPYTTRATPQKEAGAGQNAAGPAETAHTSNAAGSKPGKF